MSLIGSNLARQRLGGFVLTAQSGLPQQVAHPSFLQTGAESLPIESYR
jgi:hypothetical protein